MSISASAVLVELNISVWTGEILDREATADLLNRNAATKGAARVKKNLMAGTPLRKNIADFAAYCRGAHASMTLPWSDRGPRVLSTSQFLTYKEQMNDNAKRFRVMVDNFCQRYATLIDIASENQGLLFNRDDYPSPEVVASRFDFRMTFSPVPESGDFRVDVASTDLDEMKESYERSYDERLKQAMQDPWDRIHKMLTAMSTKLTPTGSDEKKRWHESFVDNPRELCELLTHLNITKDPELEEARARLENAMLGVGIEDLKEHPHVRAKVKHNVDTLLQQFDW